MYLLKPIPGQQSAYEVHLTTNDRFIGNWIGLCFYPALDYKVIPFTLMRFLVSFEGIFQCDWKI